MQAFRKLISVRIYLLGFVEALLVAACYTAVLFWVQPVAAATYIEFEGGALHIAFVALTFLISTYLFDLHRQWYPTSRVLLTLQVSQLIGIILLIQAALAFITAELALPQIVVLAGSLVLLLMLVLWRIFIRPVLWSAFGAQRVLFVGWSGVVEDLRVAFSTEPSRSTEVIGFITTTPEDESNINGRILGPPSYLKTAVTEFKPDGVIVAADNVTHPALLTDLLDLTAAGIFVQTASQAYESAFSRIDCRGLHPYAVVFLDSLMAPPASVALQSVYTNILALAATILSLPLLALIAIWKKISSSGPVFEKYLCIGLHGIPFELYRFNCHQASSTTLIDRILLRYKLAGLPQVINLMRGELALIGPRPERAEFNEILCQLIPFYRQKQSLKPGLYGWSQMHCDSSPQEDTLRRLEYDLYYIKHMSVTLDVYIILLACRWALSGERTRQAEARLAREV